jgi:hypothetical protein
VHPPPHQPGLIFHHDGIYARKRQLPLCVHVLCDINSHTQLPQLTHTEPHKAKRVFLERIAFAFLTDLSLLMPLCVHEFCGVDSLLPEGCTIYSTHNCLSWAHTEPHNANSKVFFLERIAFVFFSISRKKGIPFGFKTDLSLLIWLLTACVSSGRWTLPMRIMLSLLSTRGNPLLTTPTSDIDNN